MNIEQQLAAALRDMAAIQQQVKTIEAKLASGSLTEAMAREALLDFQQKIATLDEALAELQKHATDAPPVRK